MARRTELKTRKKNEYIADTMIEKCIQQKFNFTMESTGSNFGNWHFNLIEKLKNEYERKLEIERLKSEYELKLKKRY